MDWTKFFIGLVLIVVILGFAGKGTSNNYLTIGKNGFNKVYDNYKLVANYANDKGDFQMMFIIYFVIASAILFGLINIITAIFDFDKVGLLVSIIIAVIGALGLLFVIPTNVHIIQNVVQNNTVLDNSTIINKTVDVML